MEHQEIEYFVHAPGGKPKVVVAAAGDTLRDVLIRLEVIRDGPNGLHIVVGECVEALGETDEVEDGADGHAPVDIDLTLEVLEIRRHRHVHVDRCSHVAVGVNFGKDARRHRFSPNTTGMALPTILEPLRPIVKIQIRA
jgi:hypothetical protein